MHDLLPAYFDGELDAADRLAFEEHLAACPDCARELAAQQALRAALRDESLRYRPPAGLVARIRASLPEGRTITPFRRRLAWLAAAAVVAGLGLAGAGVALLSRVPSAEDRLAQEVTAGHARSLLAEHLLDVPSTDQHVVKPWFQGRLDFAPPVKDLKDQGFPLAGGRLDFLDGRTTAALVYRRRQHVINLFVWPATGDGDSDIRAVSRRGYHLAHWVEGGLNFWAVSDLNAEDLGEFARLMHDPTP
jgi:anti-sigma factor RsiW